MRTEREGMIVMNSDRRKAEVLDSIVEYLELAAEDSEHNEDELDTILWLLANPDTTVWDSPIIIRPQKGDEIE